MALKYLMLPNFNPAPVVDGNKEIRSYGPRGDNWSINHLPTMALWGGGNHTAQLAVPMFTIAAFEHNMGRVILPMFTILAYDN